MEDADEERSRSIPSRTKLGKRAATIDKFPFLGEPLVLLGGLITIPFWAYRSTSLAMLDIMMSDLPRVEYGKGDKITSSDLRRAEEKNKELTNRVKEHGIGANLSSMVNAKNYIKSKVR